MSTGLDAQLQIQAKATTLTAGTTLSTYSVDQQAAKRHVELGETIGFGVFVSASAKTSAETYTFNVVDADNAALNSNLVIIGSSGAILGSDARMDTTSADFKAGVFVPIPVGSLTKEFVGLQFVLGNGGGTASLNADVFLMNQGEWSQYNAPAANYTP